MSKIIFPQIPEYTDRESKQKYTFDKYEQILKGKILDVGADQQHLKKYLPAEVEYTGIDIEGSGEVRKVDLEKEKVPFADRAFDCVVCLDVLEHVENTHEVFDELCRVSQDWVLISLPNPYSGFMAYLERGQYSPGRNIKYYGLTTEREIDRHKWFFSASEAREYVAYRAEKNGYEVYDLFIQNEGADGLPPSEIEAEKIKQARALLFGGNPNYPDLYEGTQWWVLKRKA